MKLDIFFDCSSPWTYLGFRNVQPIAEKYGVDIDWKPILVGGVFNTVNQSVYEQRANPVRVKARYMRKDLQDWARLANLDIIFPPAIFPINSVKAMRACIVLNETGRLVAFAEQVFQAYWSHNLDISDDTILQACLEAAGAEAEAVLTAIKTEDVKARLRANTEALIARGGFGSPTFFIGEDMFFGNDRLPLVEAALGRLRDEAVISRKPGHTVT